MGLCHRVCTSQAVPCLTGLSFQSASILVRRDVEMMVNIFVLIPMYQRIAWTEHWHTVVKIQFVRYSKSCKESLEFY